MNEKTAKLIHLRPCEEDGKSLIHTHEHNCRVITSVEKTGYSSLYSSKPHYAYILEVMDNDHEGWYFKGTEPVWNDPKQKSNYSKLDRRVQQGCRKVVATDDMRMLGARPYSLVELSHEALDYIGHNIMYHVPGEIHQISIPVEFFTKDGAIC